MLRRLKKIILEKGIAVVAVELGYRSPSTISAWIKKNEIPALARVKVKEYLNVKYNSKR